MSIKLHQLVVLAFFVLALVSAMPHETRIPTDIAASDIVMADTSLNQKLSVVLTKTDVNIYRFQDSDTFTLISKKPSCEASTLSISQAGILPSNGDVYSVIVGCKDGYFHIYEVSVQKGEIVKSFAKKLGQPVEQFLSAFPYLLISTSNHIYMFNMNEYKVELQIPISGPLAQVIYQDASRFISAQDQASSIQINLKSEGVEIKRKPLMQRIVLSRSRLLQNATSPKCGDGNTDYTLGEQCDDGNVISGDGCTSTCLIEKCGDGIKNNSPNEECDDGNAVDGDGCTDCKKDCGNGIKTENEECDDGNLVDGDGCSSLCVKEKSESYKAAVGIAAGGTAVGAAAAVAGSSAAPAASSVSSSLIGTTPISQAGGAVAQNVAQNLGQNVAQNAGQLKA